MYLAIVERLFIIFAMYLWLYATIHDRQLLRQLLDPNILILGSTVSLSMCMTVYHTFIPQKHHILNTLALYETTIVLYWVILYL